MAFIGRGYSSPDGDIGATGGTNNSNQRASLAGTMPENGWIWRIGGRFAVWHTDPGSSSVRLSVFAVNSSDDPSTRECYTAAFTVSAEGSYAGEAAAFTATINSSVGPSNSSLPKTSGKRVALGFSHTGNALMHQMVAAADIANLNENLYRKNNPSNIPTDPFAATTISNEGVMTLWAEYDPNVKPNTPTGLSPTGSINTFSPTFTSNFADSNENRGDALNRYQIEMRTGSTSGSLKWNPTIDASNSEISADQTSIDYNGTTLIAGTTYYWRIRHSDYFDEWSSWSSWQSFTINAGGTMGQATTPVGKQETVQPGPFSAIWSHASGLSTNAIEIRLIQNGSVVRGPTQRAVTVANGGAASFTWAQTGFSDLSWGGTYAIEMRGRDTGNLWSPWGNQRTININARPSIPSNLSPALSQAFTSYPKLTCIATDADDTVGSGLTVSARIKNDAGTVLQTRTMTLNGSTGKWEYQTTAADLATFATYKWDARSGDGTLFSSYSSEAVFAYGNGPVITGTYPTEAQVVTTNRPVITWTTTGQISKRVFIYRASDADLLHNSGTIADTVLSYQVPAGVLFNNSAYFYIVTVTNSVPLSGSSAPINFSVAYPAPITVANFTVSPVDDRMVLLGWEVAEDAPGSFKEYRLSRRDLETGEVKLIANEIPITQNTFEDWFVPSGKMFEWGIAKVTYQGNGEETQSAYVYAQTQINLKFPIMTAVTNPGDYVVEMPLVRGFDIDLVENTAEIFTWGSKAPTVLTDTSFYRVATGTVDYQNDRWGAPVSRIQTLKDLKASRKLVCYRDERGEVLFAHLRVKARYGPLRTYSVDITLTETSFTEDLAG